MENGFKCDFCNNRFKTAAGVRSHSFLIHKKASHNLEVKTYKCDHCDFTANLEGHLDAHIAVSLSYFMKLICFDIALKIIVICINIA